MGPLFSLLLLGLSPLDLPIYFLCSHKRGELASLVEGLRTGKETSLEEFIISAPNVLTENQGNQIRLYGPEKGLSYIAKPATGVSFISHHGSALNQSIPLVDPLVTLFSSVHEKMSNRGSKGSMLYPNLGSILNAGEYHNKNAHWDIESQTDGEDHESEASGAYCDESLRSPLISCQTTSMGTPRSGGSEDGKKEGGVRRVYLHQDSALGCRPASVVSISGVRQERKLIHAGLVSQPDVSLKEPTSLRSLRAEKVPPSEAVIKGPTWRDLLEPGVKHALVVGIGLQILQQIVGINGVLYYTLQVYEQASIAVLLFNIGCQHYQLGNCSECNNLHRRACCFVMAFGVTPNIVCLEIIPTSIHGLCIAICALAFWIGDVIITYAFPVMLSSVEFAGIFRICVVGCIVPGYLFT
ncbi:hypothetical protein ACFX1R_028438 [Malus domestica]